MTRSLLRVVTLLAALAGLFDLPGAAMAQGPRPVDQQHILAQQDVPLPPGAQPPGRQFPANPPGGVMAPSATFAELLHLFSAVYIEPNGSELYRALMLAPGPSMIGIGHALARQTEFLSGSPNGQAIVNQLYGELWTFADWLSQEYAKQGHGYVSAQELFALADRAARGGEVEQIRQTFNIEPDAVPAIVSLGGEPAYREAYGKAFDSLRRREDEINLLGERPFDSEDAQSQCITAYNQGVDAWNMALRAWAAGNPGASEQYVTQANYYWVDICQKISGCVLGTLPANFNEYSGPWMLDRFNIWGKGLSDPLPHFKTE